MIIYGEEKKTRYGKPMYLLKFDSAEEADELWERLDYLQEHGGFDENDKRLLEEATNMLRKRCVHDERYDEDEQVGTIIYSSEVGGLLSKLLLSCIVFSEQIKVLELEKTKSDLLLQLLELKNIQDSVIGRFEDLVDVDPFEEAEKADETDANS